MKEIMEKIEEFCITNFVEYWQVVLGVLAALFVLLVVFIIIAAVKSGKASKLKAQLNATQPVSNGSSETNNEITVNNVKEYQELYKSECERNTALNNEIERLKNQLSTFDENDIDSTDSDLARKYNNSKTEIERLNDEIVRLNNENGRLREDNEKIKSGKPLGADADISRQYQALKVTYTEEKQEVDRLAEENENLIRNLSAKERELALKEKELERTQTALSKANTKAASTSVKSAAGASTTAATVDAPAAKATKAAKTVKVEEAADNSNDAQYYVVYDKARADWAVKREGAARATRRMATKEEAVKFAKEISKKNDANLAIKKKDGKFQKTKY